MYRRIAQEPRIDLTVYYCSRQGVEAYVDQGFNQVVQWDTNLLEGYKHKFLPNLSRTNSVGGFLSLMNPAIVSELRREHFDALWVHGHNYATYIMAIGAARALGIPVLMRSETHLLLQRSRWKQTLRRPIMTLFYRNCAAFLAIGSRNMDFYQHHGVPHERIHLVPYTVDNAHFLERSSVHPDERKALRSSLGLSPNTTAVLFASKLSPRKHPEHLLEAYSILKQAGMDTALLFIGSGSEENSLRQFVAEHNLQDVHFLGFRNQSELPKWYAAADVFVLPSENEPWGLVVNEVMCAGLPVIVADMVGAAPDLVHEGENGYTFGVGNVEALAKHLQHLCVNNDLRRRMGVASRQIIQQWSYEEVVMGMLAALEGLPK
jgi:glycosyltransferase involved in cell wall biosynthesis